MRFIFCRICIDFSRLCVNHYVQIQIRSHFIETHTKKNVTVKITEHYKDKHLEQNNVTVKTTKLKISM